MHSLGQRTKTVAMITALTWVGSAGQAAPHAQTGKTNLDLQNIARQLVAKDEAIDGLRTQIKNLQATSPASESGIGNHLSEKPPLKQVLSTLSKAQIHVLFADKDRTIADLQKQLSALLSKKETPSTPAIVPVVTTQDTPTTPDPPAKKLAIPKYHYVTTYEMKLSPSISFEPWNIATDAKGLLYVGVDKYGIRVYDHDEFQGSIGYPDMADAKRAVDSSGVPIEPAGDHGFGPETDPIFRAHDPNGDDFVLIDDRYTLSINGHIWKPTTLTVDGDRTLVADDFTKTIQIFKNGVFEYSIFLPPPPGGHDSEGRFKGLVLTSPNDLFILDAGNNCLMHLNIETNKVDGIYGYKGTGKSELRGPIGMALKRDTLEMYICDSVNNRVVVFDTKGKYVRSFGTKGKGDGQFTSLESIALDNSGHVYVSDAKRIEVFTTDGDYLTQFGPVPSDVSAKGPNEALSDVYGIAVDDKGTIYASDPSGYNIKVYAMDSNESP